MTPGVKKTWDTLERGDVISTRIPAFGPGIVLCVVTEASDTITTLPQDAPIHASRAQGGRNATRTETAAECCEPRLALLGETGRCTHYCTYVIRAGVSPVTVRGFLDLDIRSAVPEWF